MKYKYRLVLRRRKKERYIKLQSYFDILVISDKNKILDKIGFYNINRKEYKVSKTKLSFWLLNGIKISKHLNKKLIYING